MTYRMSQHAVLMLGSGTVQLISSGYTIDQSVDTPESTTFGNTGRRHIVGLKGGTFSLDGLVSDSSLEDHYDWINHKTSIGTTDITWGRAGEKWAVLIPEGYGGGSSPMIAFKFFTSGLNIGGAVGDRYTFAFTAQIDGDVYAGNQLLDFRRNSTGAASQGALTQIGTELLGAATSEETRKDHLLIVAFKDRESVVHTDGVKLSVVDEYGSGPPTRVLNSTNVLTNDNALSVIRYPVDMDSTKMRLRFGAGSTYRLGFLASDDADAKDKIGANSSDTTSSVKVGVLAPDYTISEYR